MNDSLKRGIIKILIVNLINLIFSLLTNFLLPKYLSVETYAYVKTFQLYISYIGILHFGYIDGMYLQYGGKEIDKIDVKKLKTNISTLRIFQTLITITIIVIAVFFKDWILLFFACSILPINMVSYFKSLYQAIGEYGKYGKIMNFTTIVTFAMNMFLLFILKNDQYIVYLIVYTTINIIIWLTLEIILLKSKFKKVRNQIFSIHDLFFEIKSGILLTLGNFSSILLTSMDRWMVKFWLSAVDFAYYSFAVSMDNFLNVAITPLTITLYNYFCKVKEVKEIKRVKNYVTMFAVFIVIAAFPGKFILEKFLNKYLNASMVMFLLFASQIYYIIIKSIYVNLYKANKKQSIYFAKLCIVIIIGFALNCILFYFIHNNNAFAIGTLISAIIWFILVISDFKEIAYKNKEYIYIIGQTIIFLICGYSFNSVIGGIIYLSYTIVSTYLLMNNETKEVILKLKRKNLKM